MNSKKSMLFFAILIGMGLGSCASVKAYEKQYINDADMSFQPVNLKNMNKIFSCTEKVLQERMEANLAEDADAIKLK